MSTNISLYIPHVYPNYTVEKITEVFETKHKIGKIDHIDLKVQISNDGKPFNAVYVHFEYWYDNEFANQFKERVQNQTKENQTKLFYEEPWFWIILENKSKKVLGGRKKIPTFDFSEIQTPTTPKEEPPTLTIPPAPVKRTDTRFPVENMRRINLSSLFTSKDNFNVDDYEIPTIDLETDPDVINFIQGIEDELNEEEAFYDANMNLVTMDARYIQELERENTTLGSEVQMLRNFVYQSGFVF
jgi:hypothetical protein